ncbi:MAG: hypothetical protein GY865_10095 [candidate division Zixibacteria bacterium]|nr:hypothetical protein [candidate division Zixibacteria bacterium]
MSSNSALINSTQIDYSILLGKRIKIITEQFPGIALSTRIVSAADNKLVLDKSGSNGKISQLIQKQNAHIQFEYKGQNIAFASSIVTSDNGRIMIPIVDSLNPMVRRKFVRFELNRAIRLTHFEERNIISARLNKLKWFETTISNIGGGGVLANMPNLLNDENFILMNIELDNLEFPPLILGRVCHTQRGNNNKIITGIEFIPKENASNMISASLFRNLPEAIFQFDNKMVKSLVKYLEKNNRNTVE